MKRNLLIYFTPAELASLLKLFDKDNSGKINCALFLQHFWNMGRMEHDKHLHDHMRIKHHKAQEEKKRKDNIKEKYGKLVEVRVKPCTEAERISAENKIKEVAAYFTREKAFPVSIDKCFEAEGLTPTQFKTLLSNNFKVVLTPGELDAVVHMFDTDGDGMISCVEFMTNFFRIGSNERTRVLIQHRVEDEKRLKTEQERRQKKIAAAQALATTKVIWPKFPEESTAPVVSESKRVGDDIETDDNTDAVPEKTPSPQRPLERKIRKPSVMELLSPDKFTHKLVQMQKRSLKKSKKKKGKYGVSSLTSLFPKASEQTKDFLLEIEEEERLIERLRKKKSTTKRSVSAVGRSSNSVFSKDEPRQRPQSTSSSKFKNRIETAIKSNQKIENNTAQNASQEDFYEDYGEDEDHNESSMFGGEDYANEEFAL